jgi:hypothetical protein
MIVLLNVSIRSAAGRQPKCDEVRDWDLRCESVTERRIGLCRRRKNVILEEKREEMIPSTPCIGDEGAFYRIRKRLGEENQQQWFWEEYIGPKFESGAACFFKAKTNGPDPATGKCEATAAEGKAVET